MPVMERIAPVSFVQVMDSCLGGLFEGSFNERQAALGLFAEQFFLIAAFALHVVQFIGDGQSGQNRNLLRVHRRGGVGDRLHLFIHVFRELLNVARVEVTLYRVGLSEDLHF